VSAGRGGGDTSWRESAAMEKWKSGNMDTVLAMPVIVRSSWTRKTQWARSFGRTFVDSRQWDVDELSRAGTHMAVDDAVVMEFGGSSGVS
jgi:hypothetical protein